MHDHHHHEHSHHHGQNEGELSETQKMSRLLQHWIRHNDDHAANYNDWAAKAEGLGLRTTADHLRAAAELTHAVSREFEAAASAIDPK